MGESNLNQTLGCYWVCAVCDSHIDETVLECPNCGLALNWEELDND